ncbi:MAG TPA: serine hydrolase domain-containing protein [Steroidobacteraceae bacterium]|nr:serine hydrolase domain-containing protein [Steroidobacteraceae bacterium]
MSARSVRLILSFLALLRMAATAGAAPTTPDARLDAIVSEVMRAERIPAVTVAVMTGDRLTYSRAFGAADLENSVPATPETLIRSASIAKSISAVAAMTLVESGNLDLDAPVQRYCAPYPPKQWPITTRELLSHTSGIRHYNPGEMENTRHYRWMADGFAIFAGDPLLFRPGTGYQYSTYGYTVVGCAIEGASNQRFQDYVAAHVLAPAAMTHTLVDDALEIVPHRARGYQKINGEVKNASLMDSSYKIPGGGYVTTAEDLVRFAQALLDGKLLKPATLAQMWTATAVSGKESYGLGFELREQGKFVIHTGGQPGTSTELLIIPQEHFAVAVLANMDGVQIRELVRALLHEMKLPVPESP